MKKEIEHRHFVKDTKKGDNICGCGKELCRSVCSNGKAFACNLEKGHAGNCRNTWYADAGTWKNPKTLTVRWRKPLNLKVSPLDMSGCKNPDSSCALH